MRVNGRVVYPNAHTKKRELGLRVMSKIRL